MIFREKCRIFWFQEGQAKVKVIIGMLYEIYHCGSLTDRIQPCFLLETDRKDISKDWTHWKKMPRRPPFLSRRPKESKPTNGVQKSHCEVFIIDERPLEKKTQKFTFDAANGIPVKVGYYCLEMNGLFWRAERNLLKKSSSIDNMPKKGRSKYNNRSVGLRLWVG